jgi:hypothetical protein
LLAVYAAINWHKTLDSQWKSINNNAESWSLALWKILAIRIGFFGILSSEMVKESRQNFYAIKYIKFVSIISNFKVKIAIE